MHSQVPGAVAGPAATSLEHHQTVVSHFNQLLGAGYDPTLVQAQWQQYYDQLSPNDKLLVSQLMQGSQPAAGPPAEQLPPAADYGSAPVTKQVDYNTYQEQDATSADSRSLNRFFGASVALDKYNAWSLARKKKVVPSPHPAAVLAAPAVPLPAGAPVPPVVPAPRRPSRPAFLPPVAPPPPAASPITAAPPPPPSANLGHKARNALYWNSRSALFDENESKSIMHQNYKSILFGLSVGAILMVIWQFAFLNERFPQALYQSGCQIRCPDPHPAGAPKGCGSDFPPADSGSGGQRRCLRRA